MVRLCQAFREGRSFPFFQPWIAVDTSTSLLERLCDGPNPAGWRELVDLYTPLIRTWLNRHFLQAADADDLTQQVLTVVIRKLPAFRHSGRTGAFRAWLRGITVNTLRSFRRSRSEQTASGGFDDLLDQLQDPASELSRQWNREHDEHVTRSALQVIRPEFKPATWLAFHRLVLDECDPGTVAAELGLSVNAVLIAKSRVLARLRRELSGLILD
jgi:RNA polymerase sigma factor (sigma-70 family)